ncbi:MAG TPA: DUF58 domain-containing protein [Steroidobacteraceae bacterium]|jgi:uncharacterized protein (DUF58 family)
MHLAPRGYLLVVLSAVLAIIGVWSDGPALARLWTIPAGLLLLGLGLEGMLVRRQRTEVRIATAARAFLGRPQQAAFEFANPSARVLALEYAPALPDGFEPLTGNRRVTVDPRARTADVVTVLPVRLGAQRWPGLLARRRGPFALAWWSTVLQPEFRGVVAPDALRTSVRMRAMAGGTRARRVVGAGAELHQLRAYVRGDPLSRIDWKASARTRALVTREYTEDQHLDLLVAIDAGRLSRVRSGALEHFGRYGNLTARLAELATHHDDRIGLVIYADRVVASCAPERGVNGVIRVRRLLEQAAPRRAESDPTSAAVEIRRLLKHRSLVILLTDLDDASIATQLARAVRLLAPPHLVMVAGVLSGEIAALGQGAAQAWEDPWIALAAQEHEKRAAGQRAVLERLGVPVVAAAAERLEPALFSRYEQLRRSRRI